MCHGAHTDMTPPQPLLSGDPCFLSPRQQHGRSCMELAGSSPPAAAEFAGDLALAVLVHNRLPQAELRGGLCSGDDARREQPALAVPRLLGACRWLPPWRGGSHRLLHNVYQQTWTIPRIFAWWRAALKAH